RAYGITLGTYEAMWRRRTRRRYGALAIVTDLTLAVTILLMVIAPFYLVRRRRDQRRLIALRERDEAAELREREAAIDAMLGENEPPAGSAPSDRPSA
ncbi:MAG TPA: hypothetical protein VJ717_17595, partial [Gemmatimonadaceae bacterium]|nr:hypothetical protein [Gemmatimonadaceae bacterium]